MYKNEGLGSLYRGIVLNAFAGMIANSIFFYVYVDGKKRFNIDPNNPYSYKTLLNSY